MVGTSDVEVSGVGSSSSRLVAQIGSVREARRTAGMRPRRSRRFVPREVCMPFMGRSLSFRGSLSLCHVSRFGSRRSLFPLRGIVGILVDRWLEVCEKTFYFAEAFGKIGGCFLLLGDDVLKIGK
ncbi:unnamed protein product [Cochlearia groenlandica]